MYKKNNRFLKSVWNSLIMFTDPPAAQLLLWKASWSQGVWLDGGLLLWSNEITDWNIEDPAFLINWLAQYPRQNYCNIELHAILGVQGWNKYFLVLVISLTRRFPLRKNKERTDRVIKKTWCYFVNFINHHSLAVISYYFQPSSPFDHF